MSEKSFELELGEQIVLKATHVRRGFWSTFTGDLVLTDRALVFVDRGLLGNYKGYTRFSLDEINQVIIGESQNGGDQLEVYHAEGEDDFAFKSGGKRELRAWWKAINKQLARYAKRPTETDNDEGPSIGEVIGSVAEAGGAALGGVARGLGQAAAGVLGGIGNIVGGGEAKSGDADALRKLEELRDMGVLSDDELEAKKRQVLGG